MVEKNLLTINKEELEHIVEISRGDAFRAVVEQVEAHLLSMTLVQTRGNQTLTAELLGLNRGTLRKKLKNHGMLH
ncbi:MULTISPECIES: helix-turn-helix domain-containing protein [unclassified Acinetobacter]|uniref:helix-turn-helix domain-containing protein n=1 Tax=unclassified Acinetobacter TaxID=196816 RepID=UPI0007D0A454|nr:helix-turn-helix domain-containing protein [Acinetobacter sp. SFA]OAL80662.1 protein ninH [Acinetobacter sp. SFA]